MNRIAIVVLLASVFAACAPFQRPVSVFDHPTSVTRDVTSLKVRRFVDGRPRDVHAASFKDPVDVTSGPCQFADGTVAKRCLTWVERGERSQIELKDDWSVIYVYGVRWDS